MPPDYAYPDPYSDQAAMQPETYANPLVERFFGGIARTAAAPGNIAKPNPYPAGSEEADWYDRQRQGAMVPSAADLAGMMTLGAGAIPAEANSLRAGIRAYHGSPHDFDAFDLSKIGTGEGAQAYGHGLYFAENEKVAKGYRDQLTNGVYTTQDGLFDPRSLGHVNVRVAARRGIDDGIARAQELLESPHQEQNRAMLQNDLASLLDAKAKGAAPNPGSMYEVNINANPEHFLDWDKPFEQQSPQVQERLAPVRDTWKRPGKDTDPLANASGEKIYQIAAGPQKNRTEGYVNSAQALRDAGIPGIKYLDQGSRGAGEGSRNYVVFNDGLISILRKYGLGGLSALPPALQSVAHQRLVPVEHDPFAEGS